MIHLEKDLYTIKELATLLNRSVTAVNNAVYSKLSKYKLKVIRQYGKVYIEKEEVKKYIEFLKERDGLVEIDSAYAMNKINNEIVEIPKLKQTRELFLSYSRTCFNKMTGSNYYKSGTINQFINFYNKLITVIKVDIFMLNSDEINDLFLKEDFLKTKERLLFTRFTSYAFEQKKIPLKNKLLAVKKTAKSDKEIYSIEMFNQIYRHVQNIDIHMHHSIINRNYANIWVYTTLLCCDFIRGSDLILNTPTISLKDLGIQDLDFQRGGFFLTDIQIQQIIKQIYFAFRNKRAVKTGELLTFLIPASLEKPLAYAMICSEYLRKNDELQLGTFIEGKYKKVRTAGVITHLNFFNYHEQFTDFKFSSLIMNRSIATYLYGSVTEDSAYDSELALILTQAARSHKSEDSTKSYIQMMSKDGSLERVSNNLFRRGHFGWLYDQLLKFILSDEYKNKVLETRTVEIKKLKESFSLKDMESLAAYATNYLKPYSPNQDSSINEIMKTIYEKRIKVIHKVMQLNQEDISTLFNQLASHSMPSKIEHAQCLISPNCEYPALINCMYCEYVLPQNLILIQLNQELLRLLETIQANENPNILKRENRFLIQCFLILSEANNTFGKEHVKAYVEIEKVKLLITETANKIEI